MASTNVWFHWALLSAVFASLTDWSGILLVAAGVVLLGWKR
jgi:uncharacterized membrane protein